MDLQSKTNEAIARLEDALLDRRMDLDVLQIKVAAYDQEIDALESWLASVRYLYDNDLEIGNDA